MVMVQKNYPTYMTGYVLIMFRYCRSLCQCCVFARTHNRL